jgi:prophage regulatory protein
MKRIDLAELAWKRSLPDMPPPDRGWMYWSLELSDAEIRSAIARTATLVRQGGIQTADHAHRYCGSLIRKTIDGRHTVNESLLTEPAWHYALPQEAKKPARNDGGQLREKNSGQSVPQQQIIPKKCPRSQNTSDLLDDASFLRLPTVIKVTGLKKTSIYNRMREKTFPLSVQLGPRTVGWIASEVNQWVAERIAESRPQPATATLLRPSARASST